MVLLGPLALVLSGATRPASLEVELTGLRSTRGLIQLCLTQDTRQFPACTKGGEGRRLTIPAETASGVRFTDLAPGDYALAVIHDENGNGRLDKMMGIPREGVGFSRNPRLVMGPPSFSNARFHVASGVDSETVRIKYFL